MILGIYGSGGLGKGVLELAREINSEDFPWEKFLFIDDNKPEGLFKNIELWSFQRAIDTFGPEALEFSVAVGEPRIRKLLFERIKGHGYSLATLVDPDVQVPECTEIKEGAVIYPGAFIGCDVTVSENAVLLPQVNIGHDTFIGRHTVIAGFANLAGGCTVGEESFIGLSVAMMEQTKVGSESIVGMGSMVFRDIPNKVIAMGNPARPMKNNEDHKVFKGSAPEAEGTNLEKYQEVFVETLNVTFEELEGLEYKGVREWDSVGHMGLICALEAAFDLTLAGEDIIDFSSFEKGKEILMKYDVEL